MNKSQDLNLGMSDFTKPKHFLLYLLALILHISHSFFSHQRSWKIATEKIPCLVLLRPQ